MYKNYLILLLICVSFVSGCSTMHSLFIGETRNTAKELFQAGNQALEEKDYIDAADYFQKLKKEFPFSPYTVKGELKLADAYFLEGRLNKAEKTYKDFESLHPGNENIPYVLYRIALCNFKRFKSIDLPLSNISEALQYFQRVEQSYPSTKYAQQSKDYIKKCKTYLARHEILVADFYWNTGKYLSAWKRYEHVLENYQELEDLYNYARKRTRMAYFKYQESVAAQQRREQQGSWKDWFQWL